MQWLVISCFFIVAIMTLIKIKYHIDYGLYPSGILLFPLGFILVGCELKSRHRFLKDGETISESDLISLSYSKKLIVSGSLLLVIWSIPILLKIIL